MFERSNRLNTFQMDVSHLLVYFNIKKVGVSRLSKLILLMSRLDNANIMLIILAFTVGYRYCAFAYS